MNIAIEQAQDFGHTYIGSEHILLGILFEGSGTAAAALESHGVSAEVVSDLLAERVGKGSRTRLSPADITPRAKRILELSLGIARSMNSGYVGTEHILLAIIKEGQSYAAGFLEELDVDSEKLSRQIVGIGGGGKSAADSRKKGEKKNSDTPTLDQFGRDLTADAKEDKIDPVIGRSAEIERVIQILTRRTKNNPCLIGEPGVGKTAVAEGLAVKIAKEEVPELLHGKRVVSLDLTGMVAGTK